MVECMDLTKQNLKKIWDDKHLCKFSWEFSQIQSKSSSLQYRLPHLPDMNWKVLKLPFHAYSGLFLAFLGNAFGIFDG